LRANSSHAWLAARIASKVRSGSGGFSLRGQNSVIAMKVRNSLKSLRSRHRDNRLVRRKGRLYIINKTQRKFKARQG